MADVDEWWMMDWNIGKGRFGMENTKEKMKVHPLLEFVGDEERVEVKEEEQTRSLLKFLQMVDEGYVLNACEVECLNRIVHWRVCDVGRLIERIRKLESLSDLDVSNTQISELPESICELKSLESLNVSHTQISELPKRICGLKSLTTLDVSKTQISELPESICELKSLESLNVSDTEINDLPERVCELKSLWCLDVSDTKINDLPEGICELKSLMGLNVSHMQIRELPERVCELKNLWNLDVSHTQIRELPEGICELKSLEHLDVSHTQIRELPERICELKSLRELNLSNTQICELPEGICELENLEHLDISSTKIETEKLSRIIELKKLKYIGLRGLALHHIPQELIELGLPFDFKEDVVMLDYGIYLKNTTLTTQPISLFTQPRELIEAYYAEEKVRISEAKVIFLGYGGAGKTYTIKRILNNGEKEDYVTEPTPGVDIQPYATQYGEKNLDIHFWDFGGQEIMHAMHRCFLTGRTCYVVVVDNRKENITEQAEYWLRNIRSFAPNCPVILAVNRIEGVADCGVNAPKLKKEFSNLVGDPIYYSAKTDTATEFKRLTEAIYRQASQLDSYGMEFPASWAAIRSQIEERSANQYYLDNQEYHKICADNGLENSDIRKWLLAWFNDLGVCFSYHLDAKKEELQHYQLLNPKWLTNALYIIINTCRNLSRHGVIFHQVIDRRLNDTAMDKKQRVFEQFVEYSETERDYILQIMRKFRLSYQVTENEEFIPALCEDQTPENVEPTAYQEKLSYEIKYDYLPDTVVHRLMILCYEQLNLKKTWNKGFRMDVAIDNIAAVVEMKNSTTLRIDVYTLAGNEKPWKVLAYLRGHILSINQDLNIKASDYVIVEDHTSSKIRHANISVEFLLNAKKDGNQNLYAEAIEDHSGLIVQVDEILGNVFGEETMRQAELDAKRLGVSLVGLLLQIRNYVAEIKDGQVEIIETGRGMEGYVAATAHNTKMTAESTREIAEHSKDAEEKLGTLIEQNDTIIKNQELALELIQRLKQENRSDLQNLAEQMQQAVNQKKNPWEKFGEFLGNGANFLTIVSTLGAFALEIVKADVVQGIPGYVMLGLKFLGKLFQLWSKIKGDGTGIA